VQDPQAEAALGLLAAQRSTVSERRHLIEKSLLTAESQFTSACLVDVTAFVDTITSISTGGTRAEETLAAAETRLVEALDRHAEQFADTVNRLTEMQLDRLSERLIEIGGSNRAQHLLTPTADVTLETPDGLRATPAGPGGHDRGTTTVDWRKVTDQITKTQSWWGAGNGLKNASGSVGHNIVKDVGHLFGKKFKPWEALKIADGIGKAAKIGGFAVQIGLTGYEVWKGEREARKAQIEGERQHAALVTEIMGRADEITAGARRQLWEIIDPPINAFLTEVQAAQDEIIGADRARGSAARELDAIASEADQLLTASSGDGR
jgi:hypothetical protein